MLTRLATEAAHRPTRSFTCGRARWSSTDERSRQRQLGRLNCCSASTVTAQFILLGRTSSRFARYTSARSTQAYAKVKKDQQRLAAIEVLRTTPRTGADPPHVARQLRVPHREAARTREVAAKLLRTWYGKKGLDWTTKTGVHRVSCSRRPRTVNATSAGGAA